MNQAWEPVAEMLRAEIAEYGRLLKLFEEERNLIRGADPEEVVGARNAILAQFAVLDQYRLGRKREVEAFATALGKPASSTLRSLLPLMVPEARPLFEALVGELNNLIHRVRLDGRKDTRSQESAAESQVRASA
jgi:hypothetical protein